MRIRFAGLTILLLTVILNPGFAKVYVVSQNHPEANDKNPGTSREPFKTITRAMSTMVAGDTVLISNGIYRETPVLAHSGAPGKPIVIMAEPGSNPVIRGSDVVTHWEYETPGVYSTPWSQSPLASKDRIKQLGFAVYGEQVFVNDQLLKHVHIAEELEENAFFSDRENSKIIIHLPLPTRPENINIEISTRTNWLDIKGDYIVISGFKMERAYATVQKGGFLISGNNWIVEKNDFSFSGGGRGATFTGTDGIVRNNNIHHNGQMGFSLVGRRILFEHNQIHHNNTNEYPAWEQGGSKVANSVECIFRQNNFYDELYGPGLWLDIDNYRNIIEQNTFDNIGFAAIMIEIS